MCSSLFTRPRMDIICAAFPFAFSIDHACLYFQGFLLHSFTCSSFERNVGFAGWFRGGCSRGFAIHDGWGVRATTTRITSHSFLCFCAVFPHHKSHQKFRLSFTTHFSGLAVCARSAITNCIVEFHALYFRVALVWICACTPLT